MLEVTVDKITTSPSGLRLGLVIRYGKDGPVRFAQGVIPWTAFGHVDRAEILRRFDRMVGDALAGEPADEPLFDVGI